MRSRLSVLASAAALFQLGRAQFPPEPEGVTILKSKFDERIEIRYKEVSNFMTCTKMLS
jgi:hypothetical protein